MLTHWNKQHSTGRNVAPLWYIKLTSSQQVVALTPNATFLAEKQEINFVALEASMLTITTPMWFKYQ
jgi:hypothetical protein